MLQVVKEFKEFIKEYKIAALAIAFVIGIATTSLIQSLVNDIIMPIITPFIPGGAWKTATFSMGPIVISWGSFLAAVINFIIIALVVFLLAKSLLKEEKVTKK
ncbi:MAG: MscL family protein [Nanoarchaeota archaeon]|mgnify:CR=1 FL=1